MGRTVMAVPVLAVCFLFGVGCAYADEFAEMSLHEAVGSGMVTASFTNARTGNHLLLTTLQRTYMAPAAPLRIRVWPGTRLVPWYHGHQHLAIAHTVGIVQNNVVIPDDEVLISGSQPVTYAVRAYCTNFGKEHPLNPDTPSTLTIKEPDPVISQIIREGNGKELSPSAMQAAVWIATDGVTYKQIRSVEPVGRRDWRQAEELTAPILANKVEAEAQEDSAGDE